MLHKEKYRWVTKIMIGRQDKRGRRNGKTRSGLETESIRKRKWEAFMLARKVLKAEYHREKEEDCYLNLTCLTRLTRLNLFCISEDATC